MNPTQWFSGHHLQDRRRRLVFLILLAALLQGAAGAGMAYVAGFSSFQNVVDAVHWVWIGALAVGLAVSFIGYFLATQAVYRVDGGPKLHWSQMVAAVAAGFGGFLAHGGSALDRYALKAGGSDDHDADVRVTSLAGLEHGVLGLFGTAAGIAVLVAGFSKPPPDFSVPWAVIPIPGFLIGFYLARRLSSRYSDADGWRRRVGTFLQSINLVRLIFTRDFFRHPGAFGMALFWASEMFAIYAGMAAFGFRMNAAQLILGAATGMVFTRRTAPLGGAGVLTVTLAATIWYSGAPLATAVLGVFAYRVLSLWLPMPFALAQLPRLRDMGEEQEPGAQGKAAEPSEPALPDRRAS